MIMPLENSIDFIVPWFEEMGTSKLLKMGELKGVTPNENAEISVGDDRVLITSEPITIQATTLNKDRLKAFLIFVSTGNDLYLRFPKKLRRRRR